METPAAFNHSDAPSGRDVLEARRDTIRTAIAEMEKGRYAEETENSSELQQLHRDLEKVENELNGLTRSEA